jgi:hypothetical protein
MGQVFAIGLVFFQH